MENKGKNDNNYKRPCNCQICNGRIRDRRTILRHFQESQSPLYEEVRDSTSQTDNNPLLTIQTAQHTCVSGPTGGSQGILFAGNNDGNASSTGRLSDDDDGDIADNAPSSPEPEQPLLVLTDEKVRDFVLRTLLAKTQYGWSQGEAMQQIRNFFEATEDDRVPHRSWQAVIAFLKNLGYQEPKHFKVCCAERHVTLLDPYTPCSECGKEWKDCNDYYVLGIHLEEIFLDEQSTKDHLVHWKESDQWLGGKPDGIPFKEIWHGQRFSDLSYFWDSDKETLFPTCCPNCGTVLTASEIATAAHPGSRPTDPVNLQCLECFHQFIHSPVFVRGCPLNQAFIFHEDGFNALVKKSRGMATIQLSSVCTHKKERSQGKFLNVYSFIPSCKIGEGIPHKLDAFLKPLIDEVVDLYIHGRPVSIPNPIKVGEKVLEAGQYRVRMLLLLGTADLKAHAEMTLYAGGGKVGCRKCLVNGTYIPDRRHYYYGNFRKRYRNQAELRTAEYQLHYGTAVENAPTQADRQTLQRDSGVGGVSILFTLHRLYGFDPVNDMVVDRMHLCFNLLKKEFLDKLWPDLNDNADLPVNERMPESGGLLNGGDFGKALEAVKWCREEKARGVARLKSLTDKLGSWKSDEFVKFSKVAREVLAGKVPSRAYDSYIQACSITQILYSKQLRRVGWSENNIERLCSLTWKHAVTAEEYYGLHFCSENLEYSTHIASDIRRHSSPDNYSCELYERAIRSHKLQKHNAKGLEKTYAERESIKQFLKIYQRKNGPLSDYGEGRPYCSDVHAALDKGEPIFLHESSIQAASALIEDLVRTEIPQVQQALSNGVAVGKVKHHIISDQQQRDIRKHFCEETPDADVVLPDNFKLLSSVVTVDELGQTIKVAKGCTCVIAGGEDGSEEWLIEINKIIQAGPVQQSYFTFIDGKYFVPAFLNGRVATHDWTNTTKLLPLTYRRDSVQPFARLKRKVILYPDPSDIDNPQYFLKADIYKPEVEELIKVPVYPQVEDSIEIQGVNNEIWFGKVQQVHDHSQTVTVSWYRETRRNGVWVLTDDEDTIHYASILRLLEARRVFGGFRFDT